MYSVILIATNFHEFQYVFISNIRRKISQSNTQRYSPQLNINCVDIFTETLARRICNVIPDQDIIPMTLQEIIIIAMIYQKKPQVDSSKLSTSDNRHFPLRKSNNSSQKSIITFVS